MPVHAQVVTAQVTKITGFTCDRCREYSAKDDVIAFQEAHHINFTGGYGSVWGDGATVDCILCQSCLKELIAPYVTVTTS